MSKNIILEDVKLMFRNFSGQAGKFNAEGNRNFCVFLTPEQAGSLEQDGWNVRYLKPLEEGDTPQAYLSVSVRFGNRPPSVFLIRNGKKTKLEEHSVSILDWADIEKADVNIRPYDWEVNGKTGRKAYLSSLYATLVADELEERYEDFPDSAISSAFLPDDEE